MSFEHLFLVFFGLLWSSHYVNVSVACTMLELDSSAHQRIECMILAHAHVGAGTMHGATLTANDAAGIGKLTTKNFNAQSLALRLATVP